AAPIVERTTSRACLRANRSTGAIGSPLMRLINRKSDDSLAPRRMHVLLLRPVPGNDRFGLGPFFRIEPLGLEYIAAALEARGHRTTTVDLRYGGSLEQHLRRSRPAVVGVACMHALETDEVLALTARIRHASPGAFILVGGHSAAAYPTPFFANTVDAICMDDGELVVPALVDAIANRRPPREVPGLIVREADGRFEKTSPSAETFALD